MSERRRLLYRSRRRLWGGLVDFRVYSDGSMRARCDHPSDDPEIEMAMAGRVLAVARQTFAAYGLPEPVMQPVRWQSDPPREAHVHVYPRNPDGTDAPCATCGQAMPEARP